MKKTQEISGCQKTYVRVLQCLVAGLLIVFCSSYSIAEDLKKRDMFNLMSKNPGIDETNLIERSKAYEFKEHLPNIIRGPDHTKESKGNGALIFAYIILGFFACLFVFYIIYTILDFWVLSRRGWKQRVGELENEQPVDFVSNSSAQIRSAKTNNTDVSSS